MVPVSVGVSVCAVRAARKPQAACTACRRPRGGVVDGIGCLAPGGRGACMGGGGSLVLFPILFLVSRPLPLSRPLALLIAHQTTVSTRRDIYQSSNVTHISLFTLYVAPEFSFSALFRTRNGEMRRIMRCVRLSSLIRLLSLLFKDYAAGTVRSTEARSRREPEVDSKKRMLIGPSILVKCSSRNQPAP